MPSTLIEHKKRRKPQGKKRSKRPCGYCRRWYRPDRRVGDRQRACSRPGCQRKRKAEQEALWRRRNPEYHTARRLAEKTGEERPEEPVLPPPLDRLPWDVAQTQFGVEGSEFIARFGRILLRGSQTQRSLQRLDTS